MSNNVWACIILSAINSNGGSDIAAILWMAAAVFVWIIGLFDCRHKE